MDSKKPRGHKPAANHPWHSDHRNSEMASKERKKAMNGRRRAFILHRKDNGMPYLKKVEYKK